MFSYFVYPYPSPFFASYFLSLSFSSYFPFLYHPFFFGLGSSAVYTYFFFYGVLSSSLSLFALFELRVYHVKLIKLNDDGEDEPILNLSRKIFFLFKKDSTFFLALENLIFKNVLEMKWKYFKILICFFL